MDYAKCTPFDSHKLFDMRTNPTLKTNRLCIDLGCTLQKRHLGVDSLYGYHPPDVRRVFHLLESIVPG